MIIDAHAHLSDSTYGNLKLYLEQLKEAGVDRGICVPGGTLDVRKMTDYVTGKSKPETLIPNNEYVVQGCLSHPDLLVGMMNLDPHEENAVGKLEKGFKSGFRGLKLSPMTHQFSFSSKAVAELAATCGLHSFPVYSHVVFSPGSSTTKYIALAKQFPKTNFILGHMGFGPADREGLEAAMELDNFFLETSSGSFLHIKGAIAKAGPNKVIYGSEFPLSHPKVELTKILLLKLSDADRDRVLGGNIKELLHL